VKLGVMLPSFSWGAEDALELAARAAEAGIDGVFCYDHLWPMGNPARPALAPFPLLGVVAQRHPTLIVGPLVARIGLVADHVLLSQFASLSLLAEGRIIAAMGTGDHLSRHENLAYGIDFAPADERRAELRSVAGILLGRGAEVWIGGGAPATVAIARDLGCTVNLWGGSVEDVAAQAETTLVSWAGLAPDGDDALRRLLSGLREAGATWAVFGEVTDPERLVRAARG
jgi:alkanesulfonate monooxygenase SsuD/methylene tetrahydromethanopterin reductase-like flavin-dependent oxidoreductase (luciferase family)